MAFVLDDIALATAAFATQAAPAAGTTAAVAAPGAAASVGGVAGGLSTAGIQAGALASSAGAAIVANPLATTSGISSAAQGVASHQAAQLQAKAHQLGRKKAQISAARERRRVIRESQLARARTVAQAESQGIEAGSTARIGAVSDITSQTGRNISFLEQHTQAGIAGSDALNRAVLATQRANLFKSFKDISSSDEAQRISTHFLS